MSDSQFWQEIAGAVRGTGEALGQAGGAYQGMVDRKRKRMQQERMGDIQYEMAQEEQARRQQEDAYKEQQRLEAEAKAAEEAETKKAYLDELMKLSMSDKANPMALDLLREKHYPGTMDPSKYFKRQTPGGGVPKRDNSALRHIEALEKTGTADPEQIRAMKAAIYPQYGLPVPPAMPPMEAEAPEAEKKYRYNWANILPGGEPFREEITPESTAPAPAPAPAAFDPDQTVDLNASSSDEDIQAWMQTVPGLEINAQNLEVIKNRLKGY